MDFICWIFYSVGIFYVLEVLEHFNIVLVLKVFDMNHLGLLTLLFWEDGLLSGQISLKIWVTSALVWVEAELDKKIFLKSNAFMVTTDKHSDFWL